MKIFQFILISIFNVLFTSADPNLFGSRKRRKEKAKLAKEFKARAADAQSEIDLLQTQNPFESAAAKSAMAQSGRKARQVQQRFANMAGGQASPEALVSAQGATQDVVAGVAGDIAVGAEAMKKAEIGQLRGIKEGRLAQYSGMQQAAINEIGTGWKDFFTQASIKGALGGGVQGASQQE